MAGIGPDRREVRRFTAGRRARYLEVLGLTGNRTAAAGAIGFYTERMGRMRKREPAFAAACEEALEAAARRLAGARGPFEGVDDGEFQTIRRGRGGRAQIIAVGPGRWSKAVEERFIGVLSLCGNVEASARAVGFAGTDMFRRRRQWPCFARRWEEALDEAETRLEFRLACIGNQVGCGGEEGSAERERGIAPPFDPDFALKFLKWREEKKRGGGQRGRIPAPPGIEEVTERIVRKVEAIKRHRSSTPRRDRGEGDGRAGGGGAGGDEAQLYSGNSLEAPPPAPPPSAFAKATADGPPPPQRRGRI